MRKIDNAKHFALFQDKQRWDLYIKLSGKRIQIEIINNQKNITRTDNYKLKNKKTAFAEFRTMIGDAILKGWRPFNSKTIDNFEWTEDE